jgi:hypothetical protein
MPIIHAAYNTYTQAYNTDRDRDIEKRKRSEIPL